MALEVGVAMCDRIRMYVFLILLPVVFQSPAKALEHGGKSLSGTCSAGGMVSTSCPRATEVGVSILESGGNAIDAAIATGFALAVTYPAAGNIGGGGFLLSMAADGRITFIDFREKAPAAASERMYLDEAGRVIKNASTLGHRSAGVPGTVYGLYEAWKLHGSRPWEELVAPAVELARDGFPISCELALSLKKLAEYDAVYPGLEIFRHGNGAPLEPGETLVQGALAGTLQMIAAGGPDSFYKGRIALLIVEEMGRGEGLITLEDLRNYRAVLRKPLKGDYRGLDIISAPPPSSGGVILLEILNMLECFDLGSAEPLSGPVVHWMVEAEKRAYRDRAAYLCDPDFIEMPVEKLISKEYARRLLSNMGDSSTPSSSLDDVSFDSESEETTHYSIIDAAGNVVAVTVTLNGSFGSKVIVGGAGFLLNNEMDDFSIKPGEPNIYGLTGGRANAIQPGKRMLSSMTPTIVLNEGKPFIVLGTPGGSTIITTVAQLIVDMVDFGMDPSEAVATPRFHHQWLPDLIYYEKGAFTELILGDLRKRGHTLKEREPIGDAQVIMIREERCGASDPRGGGRSLGSK